jgi:hypothetical protein
VSLLIRTCPHHPRLPTPCEIALDGPLDFSNPDLTTPSARYVFGGSDASGNYMNDLWAFDFEFGVWSQVQSTYYVSAGEGREEGPSERLFRP